MKIIVINKTENSIDFLIEREDGIYNNVNVTSKFTNKEIENLNDDQIKTLAFDKVKHIAERVFSQIEPLGEDENPVGFKLERLPEAPSNLYKPKWNGVEWIESLTEEVNKIEEDKILSNILPSQDEIQEAELEVKIITLITEMGVV